MKKFICRGTKSLGGRGELAAARFLKQSGYRILLRNFRHYAGEIDIIAVKWSVLCFVEVKTSAVGGEVDPLDRIDRDKLARLARAERKFCDEYWRLLKRARITVLRLDKISVRFAPDSRRSCQIEHHLGDRRPVPG